MTWYMYLMACGLCIYYKYDLWWQDLIGLALAVFCVVRADKKEARYRDKVNQLEKDLCKLKDELYSRRIL